MKTYVASYDSTCPECMQHIAADVDEIAKYEDVWMHDHCAEDCVERERKAREKEIEKDPFAGADDPVARYRSRR